MSRETDPFEPFTIWEDKLPSGEVATVFIYPTPSQVFAVLHVNHQMRQLDRFRCAEEAIQRAWDLRRELFGAAGQAS